MIVVCRVVGIGLTRAVPNERLSEERHYECMRRDWCYRSEAHLSGDQLVGSEDMVDRTIEVNSNIGKRWLRDFGRTEKTHGGLM